MSSLSSELNVFLRRIEQLENERDAAIARAERAEFENGELLDDVAELKANLATMTRVADELVTKYEGAAA